MKNNFILCILAATIFVISANQKINGQTSKLTINQLMVTNESGDGDAGMIADEQLASGDPGSNNGGTPITKWTTITSGTYPKSAYLDLGYVAEVTKICIYDANGSANLTIEYGIPGTWTVLLTDPLTNYNKWNTHNVNIQTRYLRFKKASASANFAEVVVYALNAQILPPAICNLSTSEPTNSQVKLSWTNVEPNSTTGNFSGFDIRYNTLPINNENFNESTQFSNSAIPGSPGSNQNIIITGLNANTKYYFAIKAIGQQQNTSLSNIAFSNTLMYFNQIESKILINASMVNNESGYGDAGMIADEQTLSGDPANGAGGAPVTQWHPGNTASLYPASAYIDLGQPVFVTRLYIRDANSTGNLIIETGLPGNWNYHCTDPCLNYNVWNQQPVNKMTRYIRFTKTTSEAKFSEVVIYKAEPGALPELKLSISSEQITNITGSGDPTTLFDEQELAGDPANSPGGNPIISWETGWGSSVIHPAYASIDLGKPFNITKIFIRDANDVGGFTVDQGMPGNWQNLFTDNLTGYLSWNQHDLNISTRYLRFGKAGPSSLVSEIVVYGIDSNPTANDTIKPERIDDLHVSSLDTTSITLAWTAPGDDGNTGTAQSYEIRYSIDPINDQNYYNCLIAGNPCAPAIAGSSQTMIITGLNYYTKYYFAIKSVDDYLNISEISNLVSEKTNIILNGPIQKIQLNPLMVLNESAQGDAQLLVDEQGISGNPNINQGGQPITRWNPGSTSWMYPVYAMIDLGAVYQISEIYLFDETDGGFSVTDPVKISIGEPFSWQFNYTDDLRANKIWKKLTVNKTARYIRVEYISTNVRMNEIVIYGTPLYNPVPEPEETVHNKPTMDQLIGVNAFVDDPLGRLEVAGAVREYHNWKWCEGNNSTTYPGFPKNSNEFDVSSLGWNFDRFYNNLNKLGIIAVPCIQENVLWLTNYNYSKLSDKPVSGGEDPLNYESYMEHADHLFQYAARYGSKALPQASLKLASTQEKLTGLNSIKYYESWNEPDKWWKTRDAYFTPYEYAAMASADADGHYGKLGVSFGVKSADPDAKFVMAGIAWARLDYIRAMVLWSKYNRSDEQFPVDVINIHHYSNNGGGQQTGTVGVSPEQDHFQSKLEEFVIYRNKYLPGKEVWISEFGFDTHPLSPQRAPAIAGYSQEEVQGQWLVRSILAAAAAGVDKAFMYMLRDVDPNSSTQFNTSGLCSSKSTGFQPKPSWFYLNTLKTRLNGMTYQTQINSGNPKVMIFKFNHVSQPYSAYVVWCPTHDGTIINNFNLGLLALESNAVKVELQPGSKFGVTSTLNIVNSGVIINVTEKPIIILVSDGTPFVEPIAQEKLILTPSMVVNESGLGNAAYLVDEQNLSGDVDNSVGGDAVTTWKPSTTSTGYPASAYIDLGSTKNISKLYLRDMNGVGNVSISIGSPGNWQTLLIDKLNKYKTWNAHIIGQPSRYIRVTLHTPNSNLSEIVIYGN